MTWLQIVVLAIVQGLTEFLPISSSGHLILVPALVGWSDQGLAFDVAVHFGSLLAVCAYFRKDVMDLLRGSIDLLRFKSDAPGSRLALMLAIGTVPAAIAGLTLAGWIEANLRDANVVVATLAGYAVLMVLADRWGRSERTVNDVGIADAVWVGVAQALALVPGTSRAGITITAARILGFARQEAARFSFLLSIPVILIATGYKGLELALGDEPVSWTALGFAALVSCIVAYLSIGFFMRVVSYIGLLPFAIYRLALAAVILYVLV